jgi:hypothetical protein
MPSEGVRFFDYERGMNPTGKPLIPINSCHVYDAARRVVLKAEATMQLIDLWLCTVEAEDSDTAVLQGRALSRHGRDVVRMFFADILPDFET